MGRTITLEEVGDRYLDRIEAAEYLGIHPTTFDRWVNRGAVTKYEPPAEVSKRTVRFRLSELDAIWQPVPVGDEAQDASEEDFEWDV